MARRANAIIKNRDEADAELEATSRWGRGEVVLTEKVTKVGDLDRC
jgi:hypothetical protein